MLKYIITITTLLIAQTALADVTDSDLRDQRNQARSLTNDISIFEKKASVSKNKFDAEEKALKLFAIKKVSQSIRNGEKIDQVLLNIASGGITNISQQAIPVSTPAPNLNITNTQTQAPLQTNEEYFKTYEPEKSAMPILKMIADEGDKKYALFDIGGHFEYVYKNKMIPNTEYSVYAITSNSVKLKNKNGQISVSTISQ